MRAWKCQGHCKQQCRSKRQLQELHVTLEFTLFWLSTHNAVKHYMSDATMTGNHMNYKANHITNTVINRVIFWKW